MAKAHNCNVHVSIPARGPLLDVFTLQLSNKIKTPIIIIIFFTNLYFLNHKIPMRGSNSPTFIRGPLFKAIGRINVGNVSANHRYVETFLYGQFFNFTLGSV